MIEFEPVRECEFGLCLWFKAVRHARAVRVDGFLLDVASLLKQIQYGIRRLDVVIDMGDLRGETKPGFGRLGLPCAMRPERGIELRPVLAPEIDRIFSAKTYGPSGVPGTGGAKRRIGVGKGAEKAVFRHVRPIQRSDQAHQQAMRRIDQPGLGATGFNACRKDRIAAAIAMSESCHTAEVCFAVEATLPWGALLRGVEARQRAEGAFAQLKVWDTAANNGVLVYLLMADHRIEIVADRGLAGRVSEAQWRGVCQLMEERLRAGDPEDAALAGVAAVSELLAGHFPQQPGVADENELPDMPRLLD